MRRFEVDPEILAKHRRRPGFGGRKKIESEVRETAFAAIHTGALRKLETAFQSMVAAQAEQLRASLDPNELAVFHSAKSPKPFQGPDPLVIGISMLAQWAVYGIGTAKLVKIGIEVGMAAALSAAWPWFAGGAVISTLFILYLGKKR